jgi:hypothetical protein
MTAGDRMSVVVWAAIEPLGARAVDPWCFDAAAEIYLDLQASGVDNPTPVQIRPRLLYILEHREAA